MKSKHSKHHQRFFVSPDSILGNNFISQDRMLLNQIKNVFRLKSGDNVNILDDSGIEYGVKIGNVSRDKIEGEVLNKKEQKNTSRKIVLFVPIIKNNNFDLILEKCTELGAAVFQPVIYKHSVINKKEKKERWERIVKEASEQCGRFVMPEVRDPIIFSESLGELNANDCFVAHENSDAEIIDYASRTKKVEEMNIFVGPEGGFSLEEVKRMQDLGFNFFNLNKNVLRSETACILAVGTFSILC